MIMPIRILLISICFVVYPFVIVKAQERVIIDQVVAVVGNSAIQLSDLHNHKRQLESQGITFESGALCQVLDEMLYQKLLLNQAIIDSVVVTDEQIEQVLDRRLRFFIQQIGSREQLEAYYGKSIEELKDEFRPLVREQELSQAMEAKITENIRVTPADVRRFFNSIPPDSIPVVESELEMAQLVIKPEIEQAEIDNVKRRLNEYRERILREGNFNTMAIMYSEDPGSARRGGELGFYGRGELFPEFEATAFSLRPGEISEVIETEAGFHILQLIERRGEQINVRHILLKPDVDPAQLTAARNKLDSVRQLIVNGEITFPEAVLKFSDDPGRINEGIMINPVTNTTRFRNNDIEPRLFFVVDRLEVGEISAPLPMTTDEGDPALRIVKLSNRIDAHPATLEDNYDFIRQMATNQARMKIVRNWIESKLLSTHISINEDFANCNFSIPWVKPEVVSKK